MGYRRLLKDYIRHVETLTGSHLIDLAEPTQRFTGRGIGELKALAAEIRREAFSDDAVDSMDYDRLLVEVLAHFGLTIDFLRHAGFADHLGQSINPQTFHQMFAAVLRRANEGGPQQG